MSRSESWRSPGGLPGTGTFPTPARACRGTRACSGSPASTPGSFGWAGGYGTTGYSDPGEDLVGILMTQRLTDSPESTRIFDDFWTLTYAAIDD